MVAGCSLRVRETLTEEMDFRKVSIDRDMSLIEFERRVLDEARDPRNPLLERVKFLGILGRNLDEFVTVRGRQWLSSPDAKRLIRLTNALLRDGQRLFRRSLVPALADAGIHVVDYGELRPDVRDAVDRHFSDAILTFIAPVFCDTTPLADAPGPGLNRGCPSRSRRLAARDRPCARSDVVARRTHAVFVAARTRSVR